MTEIYKVDGFWFMVFNTTCKYISVTKYIVAVSFIGGRNRSTRRKPPTCRNITDKLYHIMLYQCTSPSAGLKNKHDNKVSVFMSYS
jgi:hypothetical protein